MLRLRCRESAAFGGWTTVKPDEDLKELDALIPPEIVKELEQFRELTRSPFTGIADALLAERTVH